jgi:protocatechuate 3,4-dioxygenase beta subunit
LFEVPTAGKPLTIRGRLGSCTLPSQTLIEVWHADHLGCYSPQQSCTDLEDADRPFHLRGTLKPDAKGNYSFKTIVPGRYLNGGTYRPSHIHFRISHNPVDQDPEWQLVTQLYFEGDPYIADDYATGDPGAKNRIIPLTENAAGEASGTFDIVLPESVVSGLSSPRASTRQWGAFDAWSRRMGHHCQVHFPRLHSAKRITIQVENMAGQTMGSAQPTSLPYLLDVSRYPRGRYHVVATGQVLGRRVTETMALVV